MKIKKFTGAVWLLGALLMVVAHPVLAQYTFTTNNNTITVSKCTASGAVEVPSTTNGYQVVNIGDDAFYNNNGVTSVDIPDSVTNIGYDAFQDCDSLATVTFGNSVLSIGDGAFLDSGLTSITLPGSVTNLGMYPFYGCEQLTAIGVDGGNPAFATMGGVLFDKAFATLVECPPGLEGDYAVPGGVTAIGPGAFASCHLAFVTVTNTVGTIGAQAFDIASVVSVSLPSSVTNIGLDAFAYCYDLTNISVDPSNPDFSSAGGVLFNKNQTTLIRYPTGLGGSYAVPAGVTNIGQDAFQPCPGMTNLTLPPSLTTISAGAFYQCGGLGSVAIPNAVTDIGSGAFDQCFGLTNLDIPGSGATSIGDYAFEECRGLTSVIIGGGVTNVGGSFDYCTNLTAVYFQGNAPNASADQVFYGENPIAWYLPGTYGWGPTWGGATTELWTLPYPIIIRNGVTAGIYGLTVSWATNLTVVVQAETNLAQTGWSPVWTNSMSPNGWFTFGDGKWTNSRSRFYRISGP